METPLGGDARNIPYFTSKGDKEGGYVRLVGNLDKVPEVLRDFRKWQSHREIQQFYELIKWLNGPSGCLESIDTAFVFEHLPSGHSACSGRLMIIFRHINLNLIKGATDLLATMALCSLGRISQPSLDIEFEVHRMAQYFEKALPKLNEPEQYQDWLRVGDATVIKFIARGDSESRAFKNLGRCFSTLSRALQDMEAAMQGISRLEFAISAED